MGTAQPSDRAHHGHDPDYYDVPYSQFLYIARGLETRGISREYVDGQAEQRFDLEGLLTRLRARPPKVLISLINLPSLRSDVELLACLRQALPELKVVLIGPVAKLEAERLLREGVADFVMESNEELAAPELIDALLRGDADPAESCHHWVDGEMRLAPTRHPMRDLNFVDSPAYELLDVERYESDNFLGRSYRYMTVYSSKGCSYDCAYCPYPFGFGSRFLFRSPELVVNDIERLVDEFGVEQICFRDQVFTVNRKHTVEICERLIERQVNVVWICETRYDVVDAELLALMRRAGCREIHYGLETADEALFKEVGKPGGPVSLERFAEAIELTKQADLRPHLHLIIGLPGESWKSIRRTIRFLRRTRPFSVQTAIFSPYPGTPLHETLRGEGSLTDESWEAYTGFEAVQPTEHMSVAELRKAKDYVQWNWNKTTWDKIRRRLGRVFERPREVALDPHG